MTTVSQDARPVATGRDTVQPAPLAVAMIGAGMVSAHHLAAWQRTTAARVVAIADPDRVRAEGRAREFGIEAVFADAGSMLRAIRPDAVDIASPVDTHEAMCRLAANHGAAILCQKPLAGTRETALRLVDAIGDRVRFMVHENWRHRPPYRRIQAWLDEGRIGKPAMARLRVESSGLLPDDAGARPALVRQPFFVDLDRFLVFEVLIHHLDVLRWLFGPLRVEASGLARATRAVRGEDSAVVLLRADDGMPILLDGTFAMPGAPPLPTDRMEILGEAGTIRLDGTTLSVTGPRADRETFTFDAVVADGYAGAIGHFIAGLRSNAPFETEARDNLEVLELVEAVYHAAGAVAS